MKFKVALVMLAVIVLANPLVTYGSDTNTSLLPNDPFGVYLRGYTDLIGGQEMVRAGAQWVNLHVHWSDVEGTPGIYDWSLWDAILADAAAKNLQVILTVGGNPSWAADTTCGPIRREYQASHAAFLRAAVERYSVAPYFVLHWALFNEPDNGDPVNFPWLGGCWGGTHPNRVPDAGGAAYAHMLSYAYPAITEGTEAKVLLGGLAYENWYMDPYWGPFDPYFLDDLLAAGGSAYFDIINFHYYPAWAATWNTGNRYTSNIYGKAKYISDEVKRLAAVQKPIICTEVGYPTSGPSGDALPYSEELSAQYVLKVYSRAMSAGISPVIWLQGVEEPWQAHKYGLLDENLAPKQPYRTYVTLTQELSGAKFVRARTDYDVNIEGYDLEVDGRIKTVVWVNGSFSAEQVFEVEQAGGKLSVIDKYGVEEVMEDGGAGDYDNLVNGEVSIYVDTSPRIVEDISSRPDCASYDFIRDGLIDILDILEVLNNSVFLSAPYYPRYDLVPDQSIDIADLFEVALRFGDVCPLQEGTGS